MADGDNVKPSIVNKSNLLDRDYDKKYSYFFNHQVERCLLEQHKVLGSKLAKMEKEVEMAYDKNLVELFGPTAQIDSAILQLMFNSDEQVNLDGLIEDLRTLATKDSPKDVTRLLDLLLVTNRKTLLTEEQEIRKAPYDLYNKELKGKFDSLTAFTNLMTSASVNSSSLVLMFSMMASGQDELINSALVYMAIHLERTWDALVLSRYLYGSDHDVTRKVYDAWKSSVMKETDKSFRMIKMSNSFDENNLKDVARSLMEGVTNKQDPRDLLYAYRCLALNLERPSPLPALARQLEMAEVSNLLRSIFVTLLSWGKFDSARTLVADLSKRARPMDMPTEVCEIGIRCHLELTEILTKLRVVDDSEVPTSEAPLKQLAVKWRGEINREYSDMSKLKTEIPGQQTVVYQWLSQLGAVLRNPILAVDFENVNMYMQCILISSEFYHEMIRWAATNKDEEPLLLRWPTGIPSFNINDDSIIMELISRCRATSVGSSTKSSLPFKEDGKKQSKKGVSKEVPPASIPTVKIVEGNRCNKEQTPNYGQERRGREIMQTLTQTGVDTLGTKVPGKWERGVAPSLTQDVRKSKFASSDTQDSRRSMDRTGDSSQEPRRPAYSLGISTEQHGSGVLHNSNYKDVYNLTDDPLKVFGPSSMATTLDGYVNNPRCAPASSPSTSNQSVASYIHSVLDNPEIADAFTKKQEELKQAQSQSPVQEKSIGVLSDIRVQQQPQSQSVPLSDEVLSTVPQSTSEQQQCASLASPPHSIPQQPTMGTCAANEVRRSMANVNVQSSSDPEPQSMQQSPDTHFLELLKHEQDSENNRSLAPDPSEMNKLFTGHTGNSKGQSTLPPSVVAEQAAANAAAAATMMHPPPVPYLVATAESTSSSIGLTQLAPSDSVVFSPDNLSIRTCESSSAESMLTPITEASRETFGTMSRDFSESDAPGLAHEELVDAVFDDVNESNQNRPLSQSTTRGSLASQCTPNERDLITPLPSLSDESVISRSSQGTPCEYDLHLTNSYNSSDQSGSHGREQMQKQADTPSVSPTITESTVTDNSVKTTEVQVMGVRRDAEDSNQMHSSSIPPVTVHSESDWIVDNPSPVTKEMQSQTSPQMYQPTITEVSIVGAPVPSHPIQSPNVPYVEMQQQMAQHEVPAESTGFAPYHPPPISHSTMMNQSPSVNCPVTTPKFAPPSQSTQQVSSAPFTPNAPETVAPMGNSTTHQNENAMNVQQNEQSVPMIQQQSLMNQTEMTTHQQPMNYSANGQVEQQIGTPIDQQLNVICTEPEVKELKTSCGIPYKFSPTTTEMTSAPSSSMENSQSMQQQPPQEIQGGGFLEGFLSQIGSTGAAMGGEVAQDAVSAMQIASAEHSVPNTAWTSAQSVSKEEIDEHAALRRQEASDRGDASEIGSMSASHPFPETYSEVNTVPSTALTTPDHNGQPQFDYNAPSGNEVNLGGASVEEKNEVTQMLSHSVSATSTKGEEWGNQSQQQQSSFHQMHQSLQYKEFVPQGQPTATQVSGESSPQQQQSIPEFIQQHMQHSGIAVSQQSPSNEWVANTTEWNPQQMQQSAYSAAQHPLSNQSQPNQQQLQQSANMTPQQSPSIPVYVDPFSQQSNNQENQQQGHAFSDRGFTQNTIGKGMEEDAPPCFGTGGGNRVVNVQQSGGHGGGMNDNRNHGLADNFHSQGGQNQNYGRGGRGGGQNQSRMFTNSHHPGRGGQHQGHGGHNQNHGFNQGQSHGFNQGQGDQCQTHGFNHVQGGQNNFHGLNQGQGDQNQTHGLNVEQGNQKQGGYFEGGRGRGGGRGDRRDGGRGRGGDRGGRSGRGGGSFGGKCQSFV
ncbi:hypothetical protein PRIPAC_74137 [Pristionchus pacificus]|uniref:Uncharacterized protein n=1 Tax=Pristionchus pacificus TaxID=54126 RepID=A0A8R1YDG6_PRIPA|nr:hypothetical protein PRIPAC_74137 [Pristionchus pacificus]